MYMFVVGTRDKKKAPLLLFVAAGCVRDIESAPVPMVLAPRLLLVALAARFTAPTEAGSQVLVIGAHHTGTSITAKALGAFGLYLGHDDDLLLDEANPLKFWERRDVVDVNQQRLRSGTPASAHPSATIPAFVGFGFDPAVGTPLNRSSAARAALAKLEAHRPWATKDPRLTLLAAEWLTMLDRDAVCVLTVRHPLEFASTMLRYSAALSLQHWASIWLTSMTEALRACAKQPQALVLHSQLVREPGAALKALHSRLSHLGVPMKPLDAQGLVQALALGAPPPEPEWLPSEVTQVPRAALELYESLVSAAGAAGDAPAQTARPHALAHPTKVPWPAMPVPPVPTAPEVAAHRPREAFATLLTTADTRYLAGALALGSSIRAFAAARAATDEAAPAAGAPSVAEIGGVALEGGAPEGAIRAMGGANREMVVLVTPAVPSQWHAQLASVGWRVVPVSALTEFWWGAHARCRKFEADQAERWGHMATKLRLWQLTQYASVLYMDADAVLIADPSPLFSHAREAPLLAERSLSATQHFFNAGVLRLRPSEDTFRALLQRTSGEPPRIFGNTVDCTEQVPACHEATAQATARAVPLPTRARARAVARGRRAPTARLHARAASPIVALRVSTRARATVLSACRSPHHSSERHRLMPHLAAVWRAGPSERVLRRCHTCDERTHHPRPPPVSTANRRVGRDGRHRRRRVPSCDCPLDHDAVP